MSKTSPTPKADRWLNPALLLQAAEADCDPRTVLFEAIAEVSDKSENSDNSNKSDKSDNSDNSDNSDKSDNSDNSEKSDKSENSDSSDSWSSSLYAALIDLEAYEAANPGSGARLDEAVRSLARLAADISAGNFRIGYVTDMLRLLDYDETIRRAGEAGELRGRNEAIRRQLDRNFGSDGLPTLNTGGAVGAQRRTPSIFDLAAQA
ncbi:MAG: hypothetical protein K2K26_04570 [Muribaculaceae bacterium]|nr:hypothetical protein [Muribaculaceae bacterium]